MGSWKAHVMMMIHTSLSVSFAVASSVAVLYDWGKYITFVEAIINVPRTSSSTNIRARGILLSLPE
jgi:hypothetical protein